MMEVLRVINSDQRPLSQRGSEWLLIDCEGQLWKDCTRAPAWVHQVRAAVTRLYQRAEREMLELMKAVVSERIFFLPRCAKMHFSRRKMSRDVCRSVPFCLAEIPSESLVKLVETVTIPGPTAQCCHFAFITVESTVPRLDNA